MVPTDGVSVQVTAVVEAPDTVGVNCLVPAGPNVTEVGVTDTVMPRTTVMVADAYLVGSATLRSEERRVGKECRL